MGVFYEFEDVDVFCVGAVGQPGQRVFYLQARHGAMTVTVKCEKQQAAAIGEYLRRVLHDLPTVDGSAEVDVHFANPDDPAFVLGPVGLGYDRDTDRLLVQLEEIDLSDDDSESESLDRGHLRVFITREQASAFCDLVEQLVAGGRPPCQWCDLPLDPTGHQCPRMN
ncbi:MAG TPA: DUF3090 family protein [Ilumatobacteraceae bacterium]|nr:DUF3090 family protein [Ilumatobacteraceae bacterium]